jgi:predicted Zn-dependent protease
MILNTKRINLALFALISVFMYQCATVAVTGRRQLALVPNSEIIPMSFAEYGKVKSTSKIITGTDQARMVSNTGVRIQKAVERYMSDKGLSDQLAGFQWEFALLDDPTVNAWCMPGGKVAFYTGIMPICRDEAGIAVVMGHEVAHAIASHGRERMSTGLVAQFGMASMQVALGQNPGMVEQLLMQSVGVGTQIGMLKFSRTHESEADRMGLIFMAMAGYDPAEAPKFWERMAKQSGGQAPPEFLSTHPSHDTRISDLNKWMPEAMGYYKK